MHRRTLLTLLVGMQFGAPAMAELSDTLHPFVTTSINYDDNLLRRDNSLLGAGDNSDTYKVAAGGLIVERMFGRQYLTGQATLSRVTYDRFSLYDYTGKDGKLDLEWHLANHLKGNIGATYRQAQSSFKDNSSDVRNVQTTQRTYANAFWRFHPSWQVHSGVTRMKIDNDAFTTRYSNRTEDATDVGFDYLASSGSKVGLVLRRLEGRYPFQAELANTLFRNDFNQNELKLNVTWLLSGKTNMTFLGGRVQRKSPYNSVRDNSSTNGRLIVNYLATGKTTFTGMVYREFYTTETTQLNSALAKGVDIQGKWQATAKISLEARANVEQRDFQPLAGVTGLTNLSDTAHTQTASLNYEPKENVLLKLNAFHETRSGSLTANTTSYRAKGISFSANAQF